MAQNTDAPAVEEKIDLSSLQIDLTQYYRYVNRKCEFSYQLPEAPRSEVIWGETEVPLEIENLPETGEIGEHTIFHRQSLNGEQYLHFDAYCIYPENIELSEMTANILENKLKAEGVDLNLRNLKVKAQNIGEDFVAASMTGLLIDDVTKDVTAYYYQAFRGPKTLMLLKTVYNAEQTVARDFNKYIRDSMIYEVRE